MSSSSPKQRRATYSESIKEFAVAYARIHPNCKLIQDACYSKFNVFVPQGTLGGWLKLAKIKLRSQRVSVSLDSGPSSRDLSLASPPSQNLSLASPPSQNLLLAPLPPSLELTLDSLLPPQALSHNGSSAPLNDLTVNESLNSYDPAFDQPPNLAESSDLDHFLSNHTGVSFDASFPCGSLNLSPLTYPPLDYNSSFRQYPDSEALPVLRPMSSQTSLSQSHLDIMDVFPSHESIYMPAMEDSNDKQDEPFCFY